MAKISPISYKKLCKIFELYGCKYSHIKGDHIIYHYHKAARPIIIPKYDEVPVFIIKNNMRVAGMTNEEYFNLLKMI